MGVLSEVAIVYKTDFLEWVLVYLSDLVRFGVLGFCSYVAVLRWCVEKVTFWNYFSGFSEI